MPKIVPEATTFFVSVMKESCQITVFLLSGKYNMVHKNATIKGYIITFKGEGDFLATFFGKQYHNLLRRPL